MNYFRFFCCILFVSHVRSDKITYDGYKVFRLLPQEETQLQLIRDLPEESPEKFNLWSEPRFLNHTVDIMVAPDEFNNFLDILQKAQIQHTVAIDDVQRMLDNQDDVDDDIDARSATSSLTWTKYYRVDQINQFLDELASSYPSIAEVITIGKSYEGRPLKVIKISSSKKAKPAIWIDAGIHAREWIAPATATYIIHQLVTNYADNSTLVNNVDWYILPVVNPDGYEYSHNYQRMWRKTRKPNAFGCLGTDGNRNFGFHWNQGGSSSSGCSDTYHGPKAFSEPETKAVADFILQNKNSIKLYLSFHSYGQMWLTPWGYTRVLPSDYSDLVSLAKKATNALAAVENTRYTIGSSTNVLYVATGGSDDWAKGAAGIKYAYTVELPDKGLYGFALPASRILPAVQETWEAIKIVGQEIDNLY